MSRQEDLSKQSSTVCSGSYLLHLERPIGKQAPDQGVADAPVARRPGWRP